MAWLNGADRNRAEPGELRLLAGAGTSGIQSGAGCTPWFWLSPWQEINLLLGAIFSTGATIDRDYRNLALSSPSTFCTAPGGVTSWLFAYSDRSFGANDFHRVPEEQWERNKTWFASGHQDLGENTEVNLFAFHKHTDLFAAFYIRDDPAFSHQPPH